MLEVVDGEQNFGRFNVKTAADFQLELAKQLKFLRNSCEHFDRGDVEEAVRIATAIRVIMHDTKNSISLLEHLQAKGIYLRTSCQVEQAENIYGRMNALSGISAKLDNPIGGEPTIEVTIVPHGIGVLSVDNVVKVDEWWNQLVYRIPSFGDYSRKDLVLAAANKDGGAHVDKKLPPLYAQLAKGSASVDAQRVGNNGEAVFSIWLAFGSGKGLPGACIENIQYFDIRQMATELLNSEDLVELSRIT